MLKSHSSFPCLLGFVEQSDSCLEIERDREGQVERRRKVSVEEKKEKPIEDSGVERMEYERRWRKMSSECIKA